MNKVIDYLGVAFRVLIAVFLFVLIQLAVIKAFNTFGLDTTIYQGLFSAVYGLIIVGAFVVYNIIRSYKRERLIMAGRSVLFNYIAAVVIAFGLLGIVTVYMYLVIFLSEHFQKVAEDVAVYAERIDRFTSVEVTTVPAWDSLLDFTASALIVPLAEELAFRGAVFGELREKMHPVLAAVLSSLIFGLLHGVSIHVGYAVFCGIALCLVYHYSGSIWISYLVHALFNLIGSSLFSLLESGALGTTMDTYNLRLHASMVEIVCIIPAFAAFILMVKLYQENSKKEAPVTEAEDEEEFA